MNDLSSQLANRFESNLAEQSLPEDEEVSARMQRIDELERIRQERGASAPGNGNNAQSRLQRRERLIRQTTQNRSMERRSFASNIQRTPVVRSQTLDTSSSGTIEENLSLHDVFDSTRRSLFGGSRISASSENLSSFHRSQSDNRLLTSRSNSLVTPEGDMEGESSRSNGRPSWDITAGLAEAFSSVRSSLNLGSDTGLATREPPRVTAAAARETRNPSTNYQRFVMSNTPSTSSSLTRSSSLRESRNRESRFRRRTIQGVDNNVSVALERERSNLETISQSRTRSSSVTRSQTPANGQTVSRSQIHRTASQTNSETTSDSSVKQTSSESSAYSSYSSYSYNGGSRARSVDLFPEDCTPILGLEDEKVKFIDNQGHCHWLSKHHQLLRVINNTKTVPEIVMKDKLRSHDEKDSEGFVATMEGDDNNRYNKLRELVLIARKRDGVNSENGDGDTVDSGSNMSLFELFQRGDFLDDAQKDPEVAIDEKYKTYSLYVPPRQRPDLEKYLSTRVFAPLYDGIQPPKEESVQNGHSEPEQPWIPRGPVQYILSASRIQGGQFVTSTVHDGDRGISTMAARMAEQRQQQMSYTDNTGTHHQTSSYQSASEEFVRQESFLSDNQEALDNSDLHSEVNLVMERIHMMQEASGSQIDTGALDYDELLMIQQALADNPSPPETPEALSPAPVDWTDGPLSTEQVAVSQPSSVTPSLSRVNSSPARVISDTPRQASTYSRGSTQHTQSRSVRSDNTHTTEQNESTSRSVSQSESTTQEGANTVSQRTVTQTEESSTSQTLRSSLDHVSTSSSVPSSLNLTQPIDAPGRNNYPSRVSASPRLQRISSSGSDSMLPLPTMDFSPLQRSPQRFNFNNIPSANDVSNSGNDNVNNRTGSDGNTTSELRIDIPSNGATSPGSSANQNEGDRQENQMTPKSSATSPHVKSRNSSLNGSAAVSPAGSDSVTTVFEEFVQTIPRNLLTDWSPK